MKLSIKILPGILATVLLTLLIACGGGADRARLNLAESLMEERPDSALAILDTVDGARLRGADRALYTLLLTQASIKTHRIPDDDSLISIAVNHYQDTDDGTRLARSRYYRGRLHAVKEEYASAIVDYFAAKELAAKIEDPFLAGMACRGIADIYWYNFAAADQLEYVEKAVGYFKKSGKRDYYLYALLDMGSALIDNEEPQRAVAVGQQVCDSAILRSDSALQVAALSLTSTALMRKGEYRKAADILRHICSSGFAEAKDTLNLGLSLSSIGEITEARRLVDAVSSSDSLRIAAIRYKIAVATGDAGEATTELERVTVLSEEAFRRAAGEKVNSVMASYFESVQALEREKRARAESHRNVLLLLSLFMLLFGLALILLIRARHKKISADKENVMLRRNLAIEELKQSLEVMGDELSTSQSQAEELEKVLSEKSAEEQAVLHMSEKARMEDERIAKELLQAQVGMFQELSEALYAVRDNPNNRTKMDKGKVESILRNYGFKGSRLPDLERYVNRFQNGVMQSLRTEVPGLKEEDYTVALYRLLGLSYQSIAYLLGAKNKESIYERRRKLREEIERLPLEKQHKYAPILEQPSKKKS